MVIHLGTIPHQSNSHSYWNNVTDELHGIDLTCIIPDVGDSIHFWVQKTVVGNVNHDHEHPFVKHQLHHDDQFHHEFVRSVSYPCHHHIEWSDFHIVWVEILL